MNSPGGASSGTDSPADSFEDLWKQLGDCHRNTLQGLEAKVSKLKKDRCLDAQRLEVFYDRNQQLKEQNKTLRDTISLLEDRLRAGGCDRCAAVEEKLKSDQDQNLQVVTKLKNERNILQDENRKLRDELQKLQTAPSESKQTSSPEQEEGVIPDSPRMPSSLPVASKLKKRKHADRIKHVRYAEMPLRQRGSSLFHELNKEPAGDAKDPGKTDVLVPNTCDLDASQISREVDERTEEAVAETCGLELVGHRHSFFPQKTEAAPSQRSSSKSSWKHKVCLRPHGASSSSTPIPGPDSTSERSPCLPPRVKRKKEESDSEAQKGRDAGVREGKHVTPGLVDQTATSSFKEQLESKAESAQSEACCHKPDVSCESPAFKKPQSKIKGESDGRDVNAAHRQPEATDADRRNTVEAAWSVDPALALPAFEGDEEVGEQRHLDLADTDCTWVSHSMLQRGREDSQDGGHGTPGLGEKANDSLDMMFDTTAYGTYKSCNSSHLDQSPPRGEEEEEQEEEEEEHRESEDPGENAACQSKSRQPAFKHVAVVRKKDERRKLKGTTCKECENYYSHLPEEEKQKKLSACSRHRFLHVPPCTPENFWEVGFPSTQTCIERGYIKEERNPQGRLRRRQPLNALFSPKQNKPSLRENR